MDIFYEESSIAQNASKGAKKYMIAHICSILLIVIGVLVLLFMMWFVEIEQVTMLIFFGLQAITFFGMGILLAFQKHRYNVSYDYCFVSGELRISKVMNGKRRKLVARFDMEDLIQVGDVDSSSFDRFKSDPTTKTIICTSNDEADEGKFFMYMLANYEGKKLFVLECREELLLNIMKFAKRTALDRDYISQEKKKLQQQS